VQPRHLARTLATGGNLLLLDEPTNDLDIDTLQNLEEALEGFAGCAVVISPTTAGSSTAWRPTSSPSRATATSNGSRAISTRTRKTGSAGRPAESLILHRIKSQKFGR